MATDSPNQRRARTRSTKAEPWSEDHSATLAEVAQHAGVSVATASRALNGSTRQVGKRLQDQVLESARELGYTPHALAQAVARGTSQFVALVIGDLADPYFASIAAGVTREAARRRLMVTIAPTGADTAHELPLMSALQAQRPRALVVTPSRSLTSELSERALEVMGQIARTGAGVVYLGGETSPEAGSGIRMLRVEGRSSSAELARALLRSGYRRFAVLSGPDDLATPRERAEGFIGAVRESGLDQPLRLPGALTRAGGREAMARLLAAVDELPECVFAVTDMMAVGAMAALRERGLRPGADVAVAGFDDIELLQDLRPTLTTVALPLQEIGQSLLSLALDGESPEILRGEVRLRESTPRLAGTT